MGGPILSEFIERDTREAECSDSLAYSILTRAWIPDHSRYLRLIELPLDRPRDPLQSTEFTYSPFLVPSLCNYQGTAVSMDCNIVCLVNIRELAELDMTGLALRVVQHDYKPTATTKMDGAVQTVYP